MATKCARRTGLLMPLEMKQEVKTLTNNSAAPTAERVRGKSSLDGNV